MIPIKIKEKALKAHWDMLNASIYNRLNYVIDKAGIINLGNGKNKRRVKASSQLLEFLNLLNLENNLKDFLHLDAHNIKVILFFIGKEIPSIIDRRKKVKVKSHDYQIVNSIFIDHGYNHSNFLKLDFVNSLDLQTCHYCNRNYIYTLDKKGKIKPEIDHFYPKSIYPFLAASFYNLIPSCQTCNGFGGKSSEDTYLKNVENPYLLKNEDFQFGYDITSVDMLNSLSVKGSITVKLINDKHENNEIFKLGKLYAKHEDHVKELIVKSQLKYSEKYREYLKSYDRLNFSSSEIDRLIIGNYSELNELHKRPLSKLQRDIAIELGLIDSEK